MSEIHILDPAVRPESLCGYTGPPGHGEPTCAACIAVDENLVYPGERWDRIRERVVFPVAATLVLVMGVTGLIGVTWATYLTGALAGAVMLAGIPVTVYLEYREGLRCQGELIETEA